MKAGSEFGVKGSRHSKMVALFSKMASNFTASSMSVSIIRFRQELSKVYNGVSVWYVNTCTVVADY